MKPVTESAEPAQTSAAAPPPLTGAAVAAWLRAHPRFLAENTELYRLLAPPVRVHGEALSDHMAAMIRAGRVQADTLLTASRATASLSSRVQEAVLALIRASDKLECIAMELPGLLAVDSVTYCAEAALPGATALPAGAVGALLGGRAAVIRTEPEDVALLHGEAASLARRDALILVPGDNPPALLALAARDEAALDPAQGQALFGFLGRAVAAALDR